ncbi:hypothetical protein [Sphingobium yanoikuyae]|uniref:hypothetical protein n=1 Tax=Sphingobium yanoikuyae TaxID=13690 RepID=UPI00345E12D9
MADQRAKSCRTDGKSHQDETDDGTDAETGETGNDQARCTQDDEGVAEALGIDCIGHEASLRVTHGNASLLPKEFRANRQRRRARCDVTFTLPACNFPDIPTQNRRR